MSAGPKDTDSGQANGTVVNMDIELPLSDLNDLSKSKKRLPSGSPQHDGPDDRSGQRKFLKENGSIDCEFLDKSNMCASDQGKTNFVTSDQNVDLSAISGASSSPKIECKTSVDFQSLYDQFSTERTLFSQLNKMSEFLKTPNAEVTEGKQKLILTPMVKSLFQSPVKSGVGDNPITVNLGGATQVDTMKLDDNSKYCSIENNLFSE